MQAVVWLAEECVGNGIWDPMPTAIVRYLTTSGFVIVADGKTSDGSETSQKIFEIKGAPAAYALYGNIGFGNGKDDGEPPPLDLGEETEKLFNSGTMPVSDLLLCGEQLADALQAMIFKAKAGNLIVYPSGPVECGIVRIANILLFGYSDGSPLEVDITFWHRRDTLGHRNVRTVNPHRPPNPYAWGCPLVWGLLISGDRRFARFSGVKVPPKPEEISVLEAARFGENYVLACGSNEGRTSGDREICASIGGRIHIAAIEPTGFHWLKPPILG
jgi:hypothetical protein